MPNLSISPKFLPPDLSEKGKERVFSRMFDHGERPDPAFKLNVTLFGKVAMVVCWYYDGNVEGWDDLALASRLVGRVPDLLAGRFRRLTEGDLYDFYDALGSFPRKDEDLQVVYNVVYERVAQAWSCTSKPIAPGMSLLEVVNGV